MGTNEAMGKLHDSEQQLHKAGRELLPLMEAGAFPPHLYMEVLRMREEVRDLEARIGEYVMSLAGEASEHA